MYPRTFVLGNKCTTPVSDIDNGVGYACVRIEGVWKIYAYSSQFYYKYKIAPKIKSLQNN